ncbi:MAG: repair exonuclease [Clostridium sp.]|nr:repair exonuclease [Clostridium sp.]
MINLTLPMKFIHSADIHLGSMLNVYDENLKEYSDVFRNAVYDAFKKIIDYAIDIKVKFLIISGDLYDRDGKSIKANSFFNLQCRRLLNENINVYIAAGNHDPFVGKREIFNLPENVFICSSEECSEFEVKDEYSNIIARVYGNSYRGKSDSRKLYNSYNSVDDNVFNVAILHTELNPNNFNYVPCTLENLKSKKKMCYWALGHIHKCRILNDMQPVVAYSGMPQGRDIGEEGIGGCLLVEVNEVNKPSIEFLPTSSVVWKRVEVDINEVTDNQPKNLTELINLMESKAQHIINQLENIPSGLHTNVDLNSIIKGYAIRWIIKGRGSINTIFEDSEDDLEEIIKENLNSKLMNYSKFIYTDSIDVRLEKEIFNIEGLKNDNTIVKEIYELCDEFSEKDDLRKGIIATFGQVWESNYDMENINYLKMQLDEDTFQEILRKARELIIYSLMEEK